MNGFDLAKDFVREFGAGEFKPFAVYDKPLDCIRVRIGDASMKEKRLNRILTMVYNSHTNEPIGFNIKGVRHLIEELGLPDQKVYQLTNILDAIVNAFPDAAVRLVDEKFRHVLEEQHLQVELDVAA